jgi:hypothetical protein
MILCAILVYVYICIGSLMTMGRGFLAHGNRSALLWNGVFCGVSYARSQNMCEYVSTVYVHEHAILQ